MKLSELIGYRNLLQQDEIDPDFDMAMHKFYALQHIINNHKLQFDQINTDFLDNIKNLQQAFDQISNTRDSLNKILQAHIDHLETAQYQHSEQLYQDEMIYETPEYILDRRLNIDDDSNIILKSHIKNLTDWRVPGMIVRPGRDSYIQDLVPLDPLYVLDQNQELLEPSVSAFTPEYQRRLRVYTIDDYKHGRPLWQLPNNQFGFIFVWNFLNYRPLSVIYRYLTDCYEKLRPGGTLIFSYNDCDYEAGAVLAENNFMCYTPGSKLLSYLEKLGFELVYRHHGRVSVSWFEVQKPGQIQSLRGGQTLAKIIATS